MGETRSQTHKVDMRYPSGRFRRGDILLDLARGVLVVIIGKCVNGLWRVYDVGDFEMFSEDIDRARLSAWIPNYGGIVALSER